MGYFDEYIALREKLWNEFEKLVRKGAKFPELLDVTYPRGINPDGLSIDTDGDSWFMAKELVANPDYVLHIGEDLIVGTGEVEFISTTGQHHKLVPDILDLHFVSQCLDGAK